MSRLRRGVWATEIGLVALAAFFGAEGLSSVAGIALSAHTPLVRAPPADVKDESLTRPLSADPILARNAFDSVTGSLLPRATPDSLEADSSDPYDAPPCAGLHAVVIAAFADPEASIAALTTEAGTSFLRRRGGEIGAQHIEYITTDRVFVRDATTGKICQAQLFGAAVPPPARERAPATPSAGAEASAIDPALARGIARVGPTDFRVDRSVIERVLADQSEVMKGGIVRPERDGDRTVGVKLSGVRPERLFGLLGLQDGDMLRSINGYEFSSPERVLEALARLPSATELRLDFTRGGQATTYNYAIQ